MTNPLPKLIVQARIGASADIALRLETSVLKFVAITGMSKTAPLRVTAANHGIPDMWSVAVIDAHGMVEMNAADSNKIRDSEFHQVSVIDTNTIDFSEISSANFGAYTGGGYLVYYEPMDMSVYTSARADIKRRVGGNIELSLNTIDGTLEIDASASTLFIRLAPDTLDTLDAREYAMDIELVGASIVDAVCSSDSVFAVLPEVTTST